MPHFPEFRMPVIFVGHGSPTNALEVGPFSKSLGALALKIPRPQAIVCISAHWIESNVTVTNSDFPKTIHDFYGFPSELYKIQYPAPGKPELALRIQKKLESLNIRLDQGEWGFDHGSWATAKWLYPEAEIPMIQLSLQSSLNPDFHFRLGTKLKWLRDEGVLLLGSGNIVHNLRKIKWEPQSPPLEWAMEFDSWVAEAIQSKNFSQLIHNFSDSLAGKLSVPTVEHYLPLLSILGAMDSDDNVEFFYEAIQNASVSMRSFVARQFNRGTDG